MPSLDQILAIILGGGEGSRLYPLTKDRSKPAVPIAGKYRLIDIPISNCINSHIYRVAVLTQFNSVSLHRHIAQTYNFDAFHTGWVQIWAAEQTRQHTDWYQGTADAVRKQLFEIRSTRPSHVLILAGDHLYRMDYAAMAELHWKMDADITVAVQPVEAKVASRLGILKLDASGRIIKFAEKPKDKALQEEMISRPGSPKPYLGSMGIYLFKTEVMIDLLADKSADDFGKHVIPNAIYDHPVYGYQFEGYWEDIGTIRSFYETNLALTQPEPPFNFFDSLQPIYTHPRFLPGSRVENSVLENVLLAEGCIIQDSEIRNSVVGVRSQISRGVRISDSIIMGADYYSKPGIDDQPCSDLGEIIPIGIGENCDINGAIIDKNARLGGGVVIRPFPLGTDRDEPNWIVREGVVVIPKNAVVFSGTRITPDSI